MARRVVPSPAALRDLANIRDWLRQPGSGEAATEKLRKIRASIRQLGQRPVM